VLPLQSVPDAAPPSAGELPTEALRRVENWLRQDGERRCVASPEPGVTVVEEAGAGRSVYSYDGRGDLVSIVEPGGARSSFGYDRLRRLVHVHRPGGTTQYTYGDNDRLVCIEDRGVTRRFDHDPYGRVTAVRHGDAGASVFRYDAEGRVVEARTGSVSTCHRYDGHGRLNGVRQTIDGVPVELGLEFDGNGRLARMLLPGGGRPVRYRWDARGRPATISLGDEVIARYEYDDHRRTQTAWFANGVLERTQADPVDARPLRREVVRGREVLFERSYRYGPTGQLTADGARRYDYDGLGRLVAVDEPGCGRRWRYGYDARDNLVRAETTGATGTATNAYAYDAEDRLVDIRPDGAPVDHDGFGRRTRTGCWSYRYDDAGRLVEVRRRGERVARLTYDHKARLVLARFAGRVERYLYGADDELVAVTDAEGRPRRLVVRTPFGPVAELHGPAGAGEVRFLHLDHQGTCHLATDRSGDVVARHRYDPFGRPLTEPSTNPSAGGPVDVAPLSGGRPWHPELRLYALGARWYDPALGRFLTPDTYTGAPDDERLVHPLWPAGRQAYDRSQILGDWLRRPRVRNRYAYCGNDPPNRADPTGHWSFGGVLLTLLGAVWTLPNTIFGLLVELTCLVGEVVRWLVWLLSFGNASWETPGFDVAASSRLNAFALVFSGGWLGSFPSLLGITFGNVFFVYKAWDKSPYASGPGDVYPPAYGGAVAIPKNKALYEHELRHTNQYGWFGPFFHLGLPLFGVYEWDVILNGYVGARLERDARDHDGLDAPVPPPPAPAAPPPAVPPAPGARRYGGYDLRRGDRDATVRYGGAVRSAAGGDTLPAQGETPYVRQLQQDLRELGFAVVGTADGAFGRHVDWAVREFQAHAKMDHLAQEAAGGTGDYVDRLSRVANTARYTGPVSGTVNLATREVLRTWLVNRWRCPVVIGAWNLAAGSPTSVFQGHENVWLAGEVTSPTPRMYARDFSRYYTLPPGYGEDDPIVLGDHVSYLSWDGPRSLPPRHTWPEAELLPEHLVGTPLGGLGPAQRSTFKVVRAAAEVECIGYFDSVNSYDNAFVSLGPCHWTLGIVGAGGAVEEGELCGYLAYLRSADPDAFRRVFEFFGARVDEDWVNPAGVANGERLFAKGSRKYAGWVALQQEDGSFARMPQTEADGDWFKSWHWFYRFVMAGRTVEGFRRRMWHLARVRLRDIRATPWGTGAGVPDVPDGQGGVRPATVGDVYTSERAMGMLQRWHIRFPAHVVAGGEAGTRLRGAFGRAAIPASAGDPTQWTDAHQAALVQGLVDEVQALGNAGLTTTVGYVHDWPRWATGPNPYHFALDPTIGRLAATANSFLFDAAGLPPAPPYT
jgi:RHS repeat-associated protein